MYWYGWEDIGLPRKSTIMPLALIVLVVGAFLSGPPSEATSQPRHRHHKSTKSAAPSQAARADIPVRYLHLYRQAGARYRVPWSTLAGVGKVESNHGKRMEDGRESWR